MLSVITGDCPSVLVAHKIPTTFHFVIKISEIFEELQKKNNNRALQNNIKNMKENFYIFTSDSELSETRASFYDWNADERKFLISLRQ